MCELAKFVSGDENEWLSALGGHERKTIEYYLASGKNPEEIAQLWLTAKPENTYGFGAAPGTNLFYEKVLEQIEIFLCGGAQYSEERTKLLAQGDVPKTLLVSTMTTAISPLLGTSAVYLTPVVVLVGILICKIGINAWCELRKDKAKPPPAG